MQPISEIEDHYSKPDPWGYKTNPCDQIRKAKIIAAAKEYAPSSTSFVRALDIGAGEGFITEDLPAYEIHGYEVSHQARLRMPGNIYPTETPLGTYDLITATGVLYRHYNCYEFLELIELHACNIVVTCNIKAWEISEMSDPSYLRTKMRLAQLSEEEFPYREYTQKLRVFKRV